MSHHNNTTTGASFLSSSPRDLLSLPFRAWSHAESFAFTSLPRRFSRLIGAESVVPSPWDNGGGSGTGISAAATPAAAVMAEAVGEDGGFRMADILHALRKFSGFFSYLTSRWSLACLIVALVINRITIYAATRRPLNFNWQRRLALRVVPILLLLSQIVVLLRAIRCQTSPNYPLIRHGKLDKRLLIDYSASGGFLHALSSRFLSSWESEQQSCRAVHMVKPTSESDAVHGTYSLLWPVFLRLCLSHLVETLSCALQGRGAATEAGMSIFEHSLAFAEAESMISHSIGLGMFGLPKQSRDASDSSDPSPLSLLTRAEILDRMNVPPELLLIALISCCNSLSSNLLDIFGQQSRFRLLNTTIWGLCFMTAILWGSGTLFASETGVLKVPTVCIVGFLPHAMILLGILMCGVIYSVALSITAYSLPLDHGRPLSLRERFRLARDNMQGSSQLRGIRFNRHDDFYTTLLRVGYISLAAARDAVFLNEGRGVVARRMTWLEEERLAELAARRGADPVSNGPFDEDTVSFDLPDVPSEWKSGYSQEHKIKRPAAGSRSTQARNDLGGVGAFRGANRCYHGWSFFRSIFRLLLRWNLNGLNKALDKLGFESRPRWLQTSSSRQKGRRVDKEPAEPLDFWILSDSGELEVPADDEFDVEEEMRRREYSDTENRDSIHESRLDEKLYSWFKAGGSWGNQDQSPDYAPSSLDTDDTTSVISMSTADSEWEEYESDTGCRTPTRSDPFPADEPREDTPVDGSLFDASTLARLLDPRDAASKQEARILAAHLMSGQDGRIMTRSQYRRQTEIERAQVLLTSRIYRDFASTSSSSDETCKPTPEEEAELLEKLIMSRRSETAASASPRQEQRTWASGAAGLGPDGPPCVICQTSPRSIITWPCRCLCVCEECRVSLAMNNFASCVTCRQEVTGFLRLWVP